MSEETTQTHFNRASDAAGLAIFQIGVTAICGPEAPLVGLLTAGVAGIFSRIAMKEYSLGIISMQKADGKDQDDIYSPSVASLDAD